MERHSEEKDMERRMAGRKEGTIGTKEETREETKEKEKEDSRASVIIVAKRDIARDSALRKGKEQIREQGRAKASKAHATYAASSDTAQPTAGPQEKAKVAKAELTQ